jgi:hypothetical protein
MRGGIILSNRLRAMQEAAENFGESVAGTREAQRKAKIEEADRAAVAKSRAIQDRAGTAQATAAEMTLEDFKGRQAARKEAEGLAGQIQDFGTAVPDSAIEAEGVLPGFQREQSMRPVGDTTSQALQDRIRASWMNADARAKGETAAFTAADVQKSRTEAAAKKQREAEDRALEMKKTEADIGETGARTGKLKLEEKKLQAEIEALTKGGMDPEKAAAVEGKLRTEFLHQNQTYQGVRDAWSKIQVAEASPAGDMSLLYGYMKLLDPTSTVREGEYATAEQAGSVPTRILGIYNKAISGEKLTPTQRADFRKQAENVFKAQDSQYKKSAQTYLTLATDYGVNPARVVIDLEGGAKSAPGSTPAGGSPRSFRSAKEAMAAGLPPGTVVMINGVEAEM